MSFKVGVTARGAVYQFEEVQDVTGGSSLRKKLTKLFVDKLWACENRSFEIPDYVVERPWKKPRNVDNKKRTEHDQESLNK